MIKKAFIYFIALTTLLFAIRFFIYKGLLKNQGYYQKYTTAFLKKNDFSVIFLGSSRAKMHYNTRLFDSLTHQSSFNLSLNGATPKVAFSALKIYLSKSAAPRYLIYETDYHNLKYESETLMEFSNYFPFLADKTVREQFNTIDRRMTHFYYDPYFSLPFTGLKNLVTSLHGWLNLPTKNDGQFDKGFFKEQLRAHLEFIRTKKSYSFFNPVERGYMDSIIHICKQNNIRLMLVSSPIFAGGALDLYNKKQITNQVFHIASINHISYVDLSSLPFCSRRELFMDHFHLNYAGSTEFMKYLCPVFNKGF